jgi:Domain of unknown function (DUF4845)
MMNRKQSGMTMLGFLITLSVIMFFVYTGMKVVPMYIEYYSVKKALAGMANEPGIGSKSKQQVHSLFYRRLSMSYANGVKKDALKMESTDQGLMLTVDYEQREQLIANLDVVGKFHAQQELKRGMAP